MQKILVILIFLILLIPGTLARFNKKPDITLYGNIKPEPKPLLNAKAFFKSELQDSLEAYLAYNSGGKGICIKTYNQVDYSLFNTTHGDKSVLGKQNFLYDEWYINAWLGRTFIGENALDAKLYKMKLVQDTLAEKGIKFLFVLEPDKVNILQEYLPNHIKRIPKTISNYEYISKRSEEIGINHINLQEYLLSIKDTSQYALYSKGGIHWSNYASLLCLKQTINKLEKLFNKDLNDISLLNIEVTNTARHPDYDLSQNINTIWYSKEWNLAYPQLQFEDNPSKYKPNALVIGDSYYFNQYNYDYAKHLFNNNRFWYYGSIMFPEEYSDNKTKVKNIDWIKEIENQDVLVLMVTSRFMHNMDWRIIDGLYNHYYPGIIWSTYDEQLSRILENHDWFYKLIEKSEKNAVSLKEQLLADAEYMSKEDSSIKNTIISIKSNIEKDYNWLQSVKGKAKLNNRSTKDQIYLDAIYQAKQTLLKDSNYKLNQIIKFIKSDSNWVSSIKDKAQENKITFDEQLKDDALWVLNNQ